MGTSIMAKYKQVDGVRIEMTQAEIDSFALVQADAEASNLAFKNEQIDKVVLQFSSNTKLLGLGLTQSEATAINNFLPEKGNQNLLDFGKTQAEVTALTGYVPPAEV